MQEALLEFAQILKPVRLTAAQSSLPTCTEGGPGASIPVAGIQALDPHTHFLGHCLQFRALPCLILCSMIQAFAQEYFQNTQGIAGPDSSFVLQKSVGAVVAEVFLSCPGCRCCAGCVFGLFVTELSLPRTPCSSSSSTGRCTAGPCSWCSSGRTTSGREGAQQHLQCGAYLGARFMELCFKLQGEQIQSHIRYAGSLQKGTGWRSEGARGQSTGKVSLLSLVFFPPGSGTCILTTLGVYVTSDFIQFHKNKESRHLVLFVVSQQKHGFILNPFDVSFESHNLHRGFSEGKRVFFVRQSCEITTKG